MQVRSIEGEDSGAQLVHVAVRRYVCPLSLTQLYSSLISGGGQEILAPSTAVTDTARGMSHSSPTMTASVSWRSLHERLSNSSRTSHKNTLHPTFSTPPLFDKPLPLPLHTPTLPPTPRRTAREGNIFNECEPDVCACATPVWRALGGGEI